MYLLKKNLINFGVSFNNSKNDQLYKKSCLSIKFLENYKENIFYWFYY